MSRRPQVSQLAALAIAASAAMPATASDYPEQEIELIIP
jgi:tripartite-type tricarboxylate transporter receptor subunit TctC